MLNNSSFINSLLPVRQASDLIQRVVEARFREPSDSYEGIQMRTLQLLVSSTELISVARAVVAVTSLDPYHSDKWLLKLQGYFESKFDGLSHEDAVVTAEFALGVILGIFMSQNWLDNHWAPETTFEKDLLSVIGDIIFVRGLNNRCKPAVDSITWLSAYESALSNAIKNYLRPDLAPQNDHQHSRGFLGRRIAHGHELFLLLEKRKKAEPGRKISALGEMIANQLAYAAFGGLSTGGRITAMAALDRALFPNAPTP